MKYNINTKDNTVTISDEKDNIVTVSFMDIQDIENDIDVEVYYKEDVINEINVLIESEDLPEEAENNEKFILAVRNEYAHLRKKYDGTTNGMDWTECLNEAFDTIDYDDFIDNKSDN